MLESFNLFDLAFFGFTILFAILAFFRGFIKEISSLFIWITALAVSYFTSPYVSDLLSRYSDSEVAIYAATRVIVFVSVFFIISISISGYVKDLKEVVPSSFNRSFGVLLGICKSILIFSFIYSAAYNATFVISKKTGEKVALPTWMTEAKCGNILKIPASEINPLVKKFVEAIADNFYSSFAPKTLDDKIEQVIDESQNQKDAKAYKEEDEVFDYGYTKKDIQKMNRLIDVIEK
jgi:uncharacterized membrane protein required for colicin V production